jgi:hypothetical protein
MRMILTEEPQRIIKALDAPEMGGLHHHYVVTIQDRVNTEVRFQKGPAKEKGLNGCQVEDLLTIAIDRLKAFQAGGFPTAENNEAMKHCMEALSWLNIRTRRRQEREVEGRNIP